MRTVAVAGLGFVASLWAAAPAVAGEAFIAPGPPPFARPFAPGSPPPPDPYLREPPPGLRFRAPPPGARVLLPHEPPPFARAPEAGWPPRGRVCFDQSEAREKIAAYRLTDPFRAVRFGRLQGEALSAKLCRWRPDEFVYEIHVLRRDGHVLRVFMNAQNGSPMPGGGPDRPPGPN